MHSQAEPMHAEHFSDLVQQNSAANLGMWAFLISEVMFFGALLTAYAVYRFSYGEAFKEGIHHMSKPLGTINTAVLLTSSLTAALTVYYCRINRRKRLIFFALLTALFGLAFEGIKFYEYALHYREHLLPGFDFHFPVATTGRAFELFFTLYYILTGVHALHLAIGIGLFIALIRLTWRGRINAGKPTLVENVALYWHFVDIVWIFLYPLFYL